MDEEWAMRCVGVAHFGDRDDMIGQWLKAHDPNMYDGRGWTQWTDDLRFARRFASTVEAHAFYVRQSTVKPLRADGKPNRPLCGYHVELVRVCQTEDHATAV